MFLELINFLTSLDTGFNVFNYLTVRAVFSMMSAMLIALFLGKPIIAKLKQYQIEQVIRSDGPETHHTKAGTPTMGGLLILSSFVISIITWGDLRNIYLWIVLFAGISFAGIGFFDDYLKLKHKSAHGLSAIKKLIYQFIAAVVIVILLVYNNSNPIDTQLLIPFLKNFGLEIGVIGFLILSVIIIVGMSNAVNLTDGLDGLAIMPVMLIAGALAIFAYISGNYNFSGYLNMQFIPGTGELLVICAALIGAGFGFLWFNTYPAEIFMGDVGSLALGAILAVIAIIIRQELLFLLMGGIFVVEALSVIIQVGYYKTTKKRIFLMAPLHHHFEKMGISEPKIIVRFWMVTLILILISLATIKIR